MAKKRAKKSSAGKGLRLYGRLLKETTRLNNALPEDRKLSLSQRRKLVSDTLYPAYKDKKAKDIRQRDIKKSIERIYNRIPANPSCDLNLISPAIYAAVEWFALDEFISSVIPNCIFLKVSAGSFGETRIFNTRNYSYQASGIRDIVEEIRKEVEDNSGEAFFGGYKKLKRGKANDGTPENYYLDMILHFNDEVAGNTTEVYFKPKRNKANNERERTVRQLIQERTKNIKRKKNRRKSAKNRLSQYISDLRKLQGRIKKSKSKKAANKSEFQRKHKAAVAMVNKSYGNGDLTDNQFQKYLKSLQAIKSPR